MNELRNNSQPFVDKGKLSVGSVYLKHKNLSHVVRDLTVFRCTVLYCTVCIVQGKNVINKQNHYITSSVFTKQQTQRENFPTLSKVLQKSQQKKRPTFCIRTMQIQP